MPPETHTQPRQIRIPDELWRAFDAAAKAAGTERSAVIREFIRWYTHRPDSKLPLPPPPAAIPGTSHDRAG